MQRHGGLLAKRPQRATRALQSALQEGVWLGENATRRGYDLKLLATTIWWGGTTLSLAHEELAREVAGRT